MANVYPASRAGALESGLRKFFQNPEKILQPFIKEGMTILDVGCGPGFFTIPAAQLVGETGKVIAADLQPEMLDKIKNKIKNTPLEKTIILHRTASDKIGITSVFDLVLAIFVIHELPDQKKFFVEIKSVLKPSGKILILEPSYIVSKKKFEITRKTAEESGFKPVGEAKVFLSRSMILERV